MTACDHNFEGRRGRVCQEGNGGDGSEYSAA